MQVESELEINPLMLKSLGSLKLPLYHDSHILCLQLPRALLFNYVVLSGKGTLYVLLKS